MSKAYKLPAAQQLTIAEPRAIYNAGKQRLNVTVRGDLIERAREQGMNISSVLEESLTERLRKADSQRWLAENAEAIAHHNARIERDGLWHKGLTPWY
ncbi:MAG: type II toxin-antitoxin system CcdA family antitoxin [Pseudomonadota bacterium]